MALNWYDGNMFVRHNARVQEKLAALVTLLEAVTVRVKTLGLSRTAEDLHRVTLELRSMGIEVARNSSTDGRADWPQCAPEPSP